MPQYKVEALRTIRSLQAAFVAGGREAQAEQMRKIGDQVEAMAEQLRTMATALRAKDADHATVVAELAALKEAARPVVEWWSGLSRNSKWNGEKITSDMVAMPSYWEGQPVVTAEQLDALAALVGEE